MKKIATNSCKIAVQWQCRPKLKNKTQIALGFAAKNRQYSKNASRDKRGELGGERPWRLDAADGRCKYAVLVLPMF